VLLPLKFSVGIGLCFLAVNTSIISFDGYVTTAPGRIRHLYTLLFLHKSLHPSIMSIAPELPPSLNLPPHLSAHKYFLVCTLTVAAWDTLVLSPRAWRLTKTQGWPALKILFNFLRLFMPVEFVIVGAIPFISDHNIHLNLFRSRSVL
jgi:hypothetical protein